MCHSRFVMFVLMCILFCCLQFAGTIITVPDPYQIFSESSSIIKLSANEADLSVVMDDDYPVIAIDYNYRLNAIFWVSNNSIRTAPLDTVDGVATHYPPLVRGTQITSMSVDWKKNRLYWTDSADHTIEQYDVGSNQRSIVYRTATDGLPLGIVVDPFTGWIYWTDGLKGTVERIRFNGTTHRIIRQQKSRISCTNSVSWPIALNYSSQHLYWSDSCVNELERVSVGGVISQTVYTGQLLSFASTITSYSSTIWWSQPRSMNKIVMDGTGLTQIYRTGSLSKLYSVRTVHPDNQLSDLQVPDCNPSCVHGFCADPTANVCDCLDTGWTGPLCNIGPSSTPSAMPTPSRMISEPLINTAVLPGLSQSIRFSTTNTMALPNSRGMSSSVIYSTTPFTFKSPTSNIISPVPTSVQPTTITQLLRVTSTRILSSSSSIGVLISATPQSPSLRPTVPMTTTTTPSVSTSMTTSTAAVLPSVTPIHSTTLLPPIVETPAPIFTSSLDPGTPSLPTSSPTTPSLPMSTNSLPTSSSSPILMVSSVLTTNMLPLPLSLPTTSSVLTGYRMSSNTLAVLTSMVHDSSSVGTSFASNPGSATSEMPQFSHSKTQLPVDQLLSITTSPNVQPDITSVPQISYRQSSSSLVLSTMVPQLPIKPIDENPNNLPTYALITTIILCVLLLAAIAALIAAALYCRYSKMKYVEQEEAFFGDLTSSNNVVNNPLYIGIRTVELLAERDEKQQFTRSSILMRDDVSIAQCSSSGSEASARSDEPIMVSAV